MFLLFIVFAYLFICGEQYILEFPNADYIKSVKSPKRVFEHYNMVVIEGDYNKLKSSYPNARIFEDMKVTAVYDPNDTYFAEQWNLGPDHYALSALLDRGVTGSLSIVIGILDTGIAFEKYALSGDDALKVYSSTGYFEQYADFSSINFTAGYDFISDDAHPNDMNGHGTSCCGIIASGINNSLNLAGIVYNASIMPVRVLDEYGEGSMSDIMSGVDYAVQNGCNVLNLSLAGVPGDSLGWHPLHVSIANAVNNDVIVICATGNEGVGELSYPAAFPEAIAVGAVDYYKDITPYSQYGANMDFVAPGGYVYQDIDNDGYYDGGIIIPSFSLVGSDVDVGDISLFYGEGTSYAAPHITAIAALLYSLGFTDPYDIEYMLRQSCEDLGAAGYDEVYGWGYPDPNILFNIPLSIKYLTYDNPGNMMDITVSPLKAGIVLDSAAIRWNNKSEDLTIEENNGKYSLSLYNLNTGVYELIFYVNSANDVDSLKKEIAVKSPFDNTAYIYNGDYNYRVFFAGNGGIVEIGNNVFKTISSDKEIYVQWMGDYVIDTRFQGKALPLISEGDYVTMDISEQGIYTIMNIEKSDKKQSYFKTVFLSNESLDFDGENGILIDCSGRVLENVQEGSTDMKKYPAGIYYIRTGGSIWKIIKSL